MRPDRETGDGQADKLHLGLDGSLAVSVNRGHGFFEPTWQELPPVTVTSVLSTDLDGDGLTDLYIVSPGANLASETERAC